jgi:hypothetical protein
LFATYDQQKLEAEMERARPIATEAGQDVDEAKDFILSTLPKGFESVSSTRFYFDFLASPSRIVGDDQGHVNGLEVEDTTGMCRRRSSENLGTRTLMWIR